MDTLLRILFVLLISTGIVGFALQHILYSRLKSHHSKIWEALGRPAMVSSPAATFSVLRFLWRKEYQSLNDGNSTRLANLFRNYLAVYITLLLITLVVFVVSIGVKPAT